MIVDERMVTYINSLDMGNTPLLNEIEREAKADLVPVIRREMQSFLKVLLAIHRPLRVLEVGTAVGFSALLFCEYGPENMQVTTIEKYEKRIPIARENFRRAGRENQITLLEGDAADILKELQKAHAFSSPHKQRDPHGRFQSLDGLAHSRLADGKLRRRCRDAALPGNVIKNFVIFQIDIQRTPQLLQRSELRDLCRELQKAGTAETAVIRH